MASTLFGDVPENFPFSSDKDWESWRQKFRNDYERPKLLAFLNQNKLDPNDPYLKLKLAQLVKQNNSGPSRDPFAAKSAAYWVNHPLLDELPRATTTPEDIDMSNPYGGGRDGGYL